MITNNSEFHTDSLPFACFLVSTKKLQFLRCEPPRTNERISFVFSDANNVGESLYLEFAGGAEAPASVFFDAIRHLRKIMDQTIKQSMNHGALEYVRSK